MIPGRGFTLERFPIVKGIGVVILLICVLVVIGSILDNGKKDIIPVDVGLGVSSREITHGDQSKKQVVFTFDGGSTAQSGEKILQILAKHHVKGTFFITGKFIRENQALVKEINAGGHEIFNHTYDHQHLPVMKGEEIIKELNRMDMLLKATLGTSSKPFFRLPYGDGDQRVRGVAARAGYQSVMWTVDAHDWEQSIGVTEQEVIDRIMSNLASGNIYLMHIGDDITGNVLDKVFTDIENKGYKIVSLTQGL